MATISLAELLKAQDKQYQFTRVPANNDFNTHIVYSGLRDNPFGGKSLELIFQFDEDGYKNCHIRHFVTVMNSYGRLDPSFVELVKKFFQLSSISDFDTDMLVGKYSRIHVEDKTGSNWQKVTNVVPIDHPETTKES